MPGIQQLVASVRAAPGQSQASWHFVLCAHSMCSAGRVRLELSCSHENITTNKLRQSPGQLQAGSSSCGVQHCCMHAP